MTRDELLARRLALQERRRHRADRRALLDEETQASRDDMFLESFLMAVRLPSQRQIEALVGLVEAGATTAAFEDHELCANGNFATALDHWLEPYPQYLHHAAFATGLERWQRACTQNDHRHSSSQAEMLELSLRCLEIAIEAGDAFITNRKYAGNGGARSLYWLFDWLWYIDESPAWEAKGLLVERCIHAMCVAAPEESQFWDDLQEDMWRHLIGWRASRRKLSAEVQHRVARLVLSLLVEPLPPTEVHFRWLDVPGLRYVPAPQPSGESAEDTLRFTASHIAYLLLAAEPVEWLLPELLEVIESREWSLFERGFEQQSEAFFTHFLHRFLNSVESRRRLAMILEASPQILQQLLQEPVHVFRLVRQRERRLLWVLLRLAPEALLAMRDAEGHTLLLYACRCRGRIERVIERLHCAGFSLDATNDEGDNAWALASRYGDRKVRSMVASLASRDARAQGARKGDSMDSSAQE